MKKLIKLIFILLVVVIIAAALAIHFFLDGAVKKAVETIGPQVTKVDVKLDSVGIFILAGSGKIKGLVLGNPEGFKSKSSISLGKVSLALNPTSLLSDKIVVRSIAVESPEITFEQTLSGNNLVALRKGLDSGGGEKEKAKEPAKGQTKEQTSGKKIQVDDFLIKGGKVHVFAKLPALGEKTATVSLPEIHLKDLGAGTDGMTPAELSKKVLDVLLSESLKTAEKAVADLAKGAVIMGTNLGTNATGRVGKTLEGVTDLLKKKK